MRGVRFYQEFKDKRKRDPSGNVIAVYLEKTRPELPYIVSYNGGDGTAVIECISAVIDQPNSMVCGSQCSLGYLHSHCKKISERKAREIHPALFEYLES